MEGAGGGKGASKKFLCGSTNKTFFGRTNTKKAKRMKGKVPHFFLRREKNEEREKIMINDIEEAKKGEEKKSYITFASSFLLQLASKFFHQVINYPFFRIRLAASQSAVLLSKKKGAAV
jgi:hypothetical protein